MRIQGQSIVSTVETAWEMQELLQICIIEQIIFRLSPENPNGGGRADLIRELIPHSWSFKGKTV